MKQLYASGMASNASSAQPAAVGNSNGRGFTDDDIEEEYLPKKAAAPEVYLQKASWMFYPALSKFAYH